MKSTYLHVKHPVLVFGADFLFLSASFGVLTIVAECDEVPTLEVERKTRKDHGVVGGRLNRSSDRAYSARGLSSYICSRLAYA